MGDNASKKECTEGKPCEECQVNFERVKATPEVQQLLDKLCELRTGRLVILPPEDKILE